MSNKAGKAKTRKLIIIGICVLVAIILSTLIFGMTSVIEKNVTEIYSNQIQAVQLLDNGKFAAILAHNVRKSGTYTKTNDGSVITVAFNTNGRIETGWIMNDSLHIPREWDDGHGHGTVFPRAE